MSSRPTFAGHEPLDEDARTRRHPLVGARGR